MTGQIADTVLPEAGGNPITLTHPFRGVVLLGLALPAMMLLFGMLSMPAGFQPVKLVLLAIVVSQIAIKTIWRGSLFLDRSVFLAFLFYICLGLAFTIYGLWNGNPGSLPMAKEYVLYVLIYMVLLSGLDQRRYIRYIDRTLVISALFICLYALLTLMTEVGIYPKEWYLNLYEDTGMQGIAVAEGFVTLDLPSLPSLLFLQPYLATRIVLSKSKSSVLVWVTFILSTIVMVFVGRRALLLVALIAPFIILCFVLVGNRDIRKSLPRFARIFAWVLILVLFTIFLLQGAGYDLGAYVQSFFEGFTNSARAGGSIRLEQFNALIDAWTENVLFGRGLGAVHPQLIRSIDQPWNYELSYVKMLFDFGLVGIAAYTAGIAAIYWSAAKIFRLDSGFSVVLMPVIVGNAAFLIGNATNPYLLKIDYLSIVFLPLALINFWRLKANLNRRSRNNPPPVLPSPHRNYHTPNSI